jgi:amino acid transporter
MYAAYAFPALDVRLVARELRVPLPLLGDINLSVAVTLGTFVAVGTVALAVFLLYRKITIIERLSNLLWLGVMATILWIVASGVWHFDPAKAFDFPPSAFTLGWEFFYGLGSALLIAVYDYWGYYNVCFLGGEVRDPARTIPRAVLLSIVLVALIYIVMNVSILGVIPWREFAETANSDARRYVISSFMERLYGHGAGLLATALIMWTAFASVFSLLLGYSRVPFAAARDGNYFRAFSRVHAKHRFPYVSLLVLGGIALVCIRIIVQFLAQIAGVVVLRVRRPELARPFRMWLYPLPAALAFLGFVYVLLMRPNFQKEVRLAFVLIAAGLVVYLLRAWARGEWPFGDADKKVLRTED